MLIKLENWINSLKAKLHAFLFKHDRLNCLVTLIVMQLKNPKRLFKPRKFLDKILIALLKIVIFVGLIFLYGFLIDRIADFAMITFVKGFSYGQYSILILALYFLISIIETAVYFVNNLYGAKDNAILLSYPVQTRDIYLSKLVVKLIKHYRTAIYFILPYLIGFYIFKGSIIHLNGLFILRAICLFVLAPIIIVFIAGLVSILFTYLDKLFKRFNFTKLIFFGVIAIGGIVLAVILVNMIPVNLPIQKLWFSIVESVTNFLFKIIPYSTLGRFSMNWLTGKGFYYGFIILGIALVAILINVIFCYRFFLMLVYQPTKESKKNFKIKTKTKQSKHIFFAFLKNEFKTYIRSQNGFISTLVYIVVMPVLLYCLNRVFFSLNISQRGYNIVVAVDVLIAIILVASANVSVANSLSVEGSEFYLLKVSPIETKQIAVVKILTNLILTTLSVVAMLVVLFMINKTSLRVNGDVMIPTTGVIVISLITLFASYAHILWSLELDIMNPKIKQVIAGEKENNNVSKSMGLGLFFGALFGFLTWFFVSLDETCSKYPYLSLLLIAILVFGARLYLFIRRLNAYFDEITF